MVLCLLVVVCVWCSWGLCGGVAGGVGVCWLVGVVVVALVGVVLVGVLWLRLRAQET